MRQEFSLQYFIDGQEERFLLSNGNGRLYMVSKTLYEILLLKNKHQSDEIIAIAVNEACAANTFTAESVRQAIEMTRLKLRGSGAQTGRNGYIFMRSTIIPAGSIDGILKVLAVLFSMPCLITSVMLSTAATFSVFIKNGKLDTTMAGLDYIAQIPIPELAAIYICFLFIILLHEIGHAAAASKFGVKPGGIGTGIYLVFPVFYSDVTGIWPLRARQRTVVNLAGIYFQLLMNLPLATLFHTGNYRLPCLALLLANTASILSSANPFLRGDGYWVFSDYFNIVNLKDRSNRLTCQFFRNKSIATKLPPLLIYSFCRPLFILGTYFTICLFTYHEANVFFNGKPGNSPALDNFFFFIVAGLIIPFVSRVFRWLKN